MTHQHTCRLATCDVRVALTKLMCMRHWRMVPRRLRVRVFDYWGMPRDSDNQREWNSAVSDAVDAVVEAEERVNA